MGKRDEALKLARDFERDGFRVPDLYERFWWLQGDATAYFALTDSLLRGRRDGRTLPKDALGYEGEIVFYEHDAQGMPRRIGNRTQVEYVQDEPIKECEVVLAPTPARWTAQDWGMSNNRQNLARIGGEPSWIQGASVPTCPICGEKMEFLMQLDSVLPSCEQSGEVYFGSGGILYVFWCERTRVSGFFMQCT